MPAVKMTEQAREKMREAAIRTWQDPAVRARRLYAIRNGLARNSKRSGAALINPVRLALSLSASVLQELHHVADTKDCSVASVIRAYIEHGLYYDRTLNDQTTKQSS